MKKYIAVRLVAAVQCGRNLIGFKKPIKFNTRPERAARARESDGSGRAEAKQPKAGARRGWSGQCDDAQASAKRTESHHGATGARGTKRRGGSPKYA